MVTDPAIQPRSSKPRIGQDHRCRNDSSRFLSGCRATGTVRRRRGQGFKRLIIGMGALFAVAASIGGITGPNQTDHGTAVAWLSHGAGGGSVHFKTGDTPAWMADHIGARSASTGTGSSRSLGFWI